MDRYLYHNNRQDPKSESHTSENKRFNELFFIGFDLLANRLLVHERSVWDVIVLRGLNGVDLVFSDYADLFSLRYNQHVVTLQETNESENAISSANFLDASIIRIRVIYHGKKVLHKSEQKNPVNQHQSEMMRTAERRNKHIIYALECHGMCIRASLPPHSGQKSSFGQSA
jgi:hypothetical protein